MWFSKIGLGGSSTPSDAKAPRNAAVFPEDWEDEDATERDKAGVSKNGSLGARARFGWTVAPVVKGF